MKRALPSRSRARYSGNKPTPTSKNAGRGCFSSRSELQQLALGTLSIEASTIDHAAGKGTSSSWQILSEAEQEVALLAAAGWPNSAIAVRRGTSTKTTDAQISSILQKLMIDSREDIVRFVPQDQRNRVSAAP